MTIENDYHIQLKNNLNCLSIEKYITLSIGQLTATCTLLSCKF